MEGEEARYVATKQNGRRLLDNAWYQYSQSKKRPGKTNYTCAQFNLLNCPVKATVDTTVQPNRIIEIRGTHSHDTDILKSTVRNMEKNAIEDAAQNSTVTPWTILGNLTNGIVKGGNNVCSMRKTSTYSTSTYSTKSNLTRDNDRQFEKHSALFIHW